MRLVHVMNHACLFIRSERTGIEIARDDKGWEGGGVWCFIVRKAGEGEGICSSCCIPMPF